MANGASRGTPQRLYEDFDPYCKRLPQERQTTLEIHLQGFKREHLKVETDKKGFLKIHGERPLNASKLSRFHKEISLSEDCNADEIRAKLLSDQGILSIVMPKKVQTVKNEAEKPSTSMEKTRKKIAVKVAAGVVVGVVMVITLVIHILRLANINNPLDGDAAGKRYRCECSS